jgi:hypothetical protein
VCRTGDLHSIGAREATLKLAHKKMTKLVG